VVNDKMQFGESMSSFNPFVDKLTIFHGLEHPACVSVGGHCTADSFLTGSPHNAGNKSPSFDQVAAMVHGQKTRYPSLVLGNEGGLGGSGSSTTLSYNRFGLPIPANNDIRGLYNAMFNSDPTLQKGQRRQLAADQRRVDLVMQSYRDLKHQIGRDDSQKLDQYLQAVRDVEKDIERLERWMDTPKPQVSQDGLSLDASVKDPDAFIRTMYNLIYLAFQTDSTRYATYMLLGMSGTGPWSNCFGGNHHGLAHAAGEALGRYDKFQGDLLAEFIKKLDDTPEADGTMLDNTIVLYGSSNSKTHVNRDYPILVAGGKNLGLKHGTFHKLAKNKVPLNNLYLTLLNALDVPTKQFSDSTETLSVIV
jgi:hypothetical protein